MLTNHLDKSICTSICAIINFVKIKCIQFKLKTPDRSRIFHITHCTVLLPKSPFVMMDYITPYAIVAENGSPTTKARKSCSLTSSPRLLTLPIKLT